MADWRLAGNGCPCPSCRGAGQVLKLFADCWAPVRCPRCRGVGRVPIPRRDIVAAQVAANAKGPR